MVSLEAWKQRIKGMQEAYFELSMVHITREFNHKVDTLSKDAILLENGRL